MDIHKWLEETALPEQPPSLPEQLGLPPFLLPKESEPTTRTKRRRKRSTSDSSLLETRPRRKAKSPVAHKADIDDGSVESPCSESSHSSEPLSGSSASSQPYARRPRRKTLPEHYQPASKDVKERGKQGKRRRAAESKKTKRKTKRKKTGKQGVGLLQSFHAKNVPKDRLTLKPREKLGIFSKGKASSPVKGRGLPDLVFSEMKFLQKNGGQPEAVPQPGIPKKKRKKDHAQVRQEEISAYFSNSVRPALAGRDVNIQAKGGTRRTHRDRDVEHEREDSTAIDNAIPTVEIPDKGSYLGFGSRGPRHESGSYISWSESIRAPSPTPTRLRAGSAIQVGQLDTVDEEVEGVGVGEDSVPPLRTMISPKTRRVTEGSRDRFQISSVAPGNVRASRSLSFPTRSSPKRATFGGRAKTHVASQGTASPSSNPVAGSARTQTSVQRAQREHQHGLIDSNKHPLRLQPIPPDDPKLFRHGKQGQEIDGTEAWTNDGDQDPSSGLGALLQQCNSALKSGQVEAGEGVNFQTEPIGIPSRREMGNRYPGPPERIPTVRFTGSEICSRPVPSFSVPGIYERQEHSQRARESERYDLHEPLYEPYLYDEDIIEEEKEEEPDYNHAEWEEWRKGSGEHAYEAAASEKDFLELEELQQGHQGNSFSNGGFWRPHKLY